MNLLILIGIQVVLWIIGFFVKGFCLYQLALIIPVTMFAVRKFGVKIGSLHICVAEILFLFFSTVMTVLFSSIDWTSYLWGLVLRVLSCLIAILDDTFYIYVTEERKADDRRKE